MDDPQTRYADSHGLSIAYQTMGEGALDIVIAPGLISHVELYHDFPGYTRYLRRLTEFGRVITFDKRGQGLSDALHGTPTLEERMDDLLAVMDAAGSEKAAIFGFSEGGGRALSILSPELADDDAMKKMFARIERYASTPSAMRKYFEVNFGIDVLDILPAVRTPSLILHREDDRQVPVQAGRHLASTLQDAVYQDAGTGGHHYWIGEIEPSLSCIRAFLTGDAPQPVLSDRVLATVLMTDIVGSTEMVERLGDDVWRDMLDRHDRAVADLVALYRGRVVKFTGDGLLAVFDGPGRAVECAAQLVKKLESLGLPVRAGLHTGEIELRGDDIGGSSVHLAARIMSLSDAGEVKVSKTVADLMIGNLDVTFETAGLHRLKGFSSEMEILRAIG